MPFLHDHKRPKIWWHDAQNKSFKTGLRHAVFTIYNDRYTGLWNRNFYDGKGQLFTRTQKLYEGDWDSYYRHGYGSLAEKLPDKTYNLLYVGEWKKGFPSGAGEKHFPDGSFYIGEFLNGKRSGYGRMWFLNGTYYEGEWKRDLFNGIGIFVQANGNRYEGLFKHGFKHGSGRFYHLDSGQLQEGVWHRDMCRVSIIVDIPYRQSALDITEYPIPPIKLEGRGSAIVKRENNLVASPSYQ